MFRRMSTAALLGVALTATTMVVAQKIAKDLDQAIKDASNFADWKPADSMYPKEDGKLSFENGKACIDKIDEAVSNGLAESTVVETYRGKMTITEARAMCVKVRDAGEKVFGDLTAAEEAQYEPFRTVLSGDKLRVYNDRLKIYKLYTTGGRVLRSPEAYRDASVWCTVGVNRDGVVPVWDMSCWRFRGMTQAGVVVNKSGAGEEPPSSAFP